jgi:hypothetical protein
VSGSKKRKRTSHQCGEDMTCNLCHAPYPWPDPECNASQPPNLRHPLRKLWEQAQRGVV